ncbi:MULTISPECIES: helix-turn-helix domain-containing protein [Kamptonema]|uniref:helix-turn-helix domain-containing protein n=1 Tax=Kamptonema TaxID=1501433 RepID=UPI0002FF6800|nr:MULTISPECIES: helix-turn-helix domain-containing protein [Kamptonema]
MDEVIDMVGVCKIEIAETAEELKSLLTKQKTASSFQKIQALYLLKSCQVKTVKDLALTIGVNRITVQRWLKKYRTHGLYGLLETKHSGGRKPAIPAKARADLKLRLSDPQKSFKSYAEIQEWLQQEYNINASYKAVYATVRYQLKAKLAKT